MKTSIEGVFSELAAPPVGEFNNRNPYISGFRRNTQRAALKRLSDIVRRSPSDTGSQLKLPEDARVLVRMHLIDLQGRVDATLAKADLKLDDYSKAHLLDAKLRIKQVLEAESDDFGKPQSSGGGSFLLLTEPGAKDRLERVEIAPEVEP